MLDSIRLKCFHCGKKSSHSLPFIDGQILAMKMEKSREVALQLHDKRGPFYDKWLAAMEKRGEQMRCKDCLDCQAWPGGWYCQEPDSGRGLVNPGHFSCKFIRFFEG